MSCWKLTELTVAELWNCRILQQVWFLVLMVRGLSSPTWTHQLPCSSSCALALVLRVLNSVVVKVSVSIFVSIYTYMVLCSAIFLLLFFSSLVQSSYALVWCMLFQFLGLFVLPFCLPPLKTDETFVIK